MTTKKSMNKGRRIALFLSDEDQPLLLAVVRHERDTVANVIRRLIRAKHSDLFSPRPQSLTLLLPQQTPDFANLTTLNEKESIK